MPIRFGWVLAIVLAGSGIAAPASAQTAADLFRGDVVGQLRLFVHTSDWTALKNNYRENTYYPADLHWNGLIVRSIGIRSRGLGSRNAFKPGLRLDFDRYSTSQKFLGLKSLVLDNLIQDPGMMRERLTNALFDKVGLPAPRVAHYGLFVNDEFVGVYGVIESIDKDFLERTLGEDGGYLYEFNNTSGWWFDDRWHGNLDSYSKSFTAKTNETESMTALFEPIDAFIHTANTSNNFAADMSAMIDLDAFILHVAAETFMAERDGLMGYDGANNFYYYRSKKTGLGRFLVWDKDLAASEIGYSVWTNTDLNVLVRRTLGDSGLRAKFLGALEQVIAAATAPVESDTSGLSWFERETRRVADIITGSAHLDPAKPFTNERFDEDIAFMIEFARHRPGFVASQVRDARAQAARRPY